MSSFDFGKKEKQNTNITTLLHPSRKMNTQPPPDDTTPEVHRAVADIAVEEEQEEEEEEEAPVAVRRSRRAPKKIQPPSSTLPSFSQKDLQKALALSLGKTPRVYVDPATRKDTKPVKRSHKKKEACGQTATPSRHLRHRQLLHLSPVIIIVLRLRLQRG